MSTIGGPPCESTQLSEGVKIGVKIEFKPVIGLRLILLLRLWNLLPTIIRSISSLDIFKIRL